jgi:hypothetical protein
MKNDRRAFLRAEESNCASFEGRSVNAFGDASIDAALRLALEKAKRQASHQGALRWRLKRVEGIEDRYSWDSVVIVTIETGASVDLSAEVDNTVI